LLVIFLTDGLDGDTVGTNLVSQRLRESIQRRGITARFDVLGVSSEENSGPIRDALSNVQGIGNKFGTF
jgi:hypothetical protein